MPININEDIEIFLNKRYAALNTAYLFERERPSISFDSTGNRPKANYQFSTGQFAEGFGQWYQEYLTKIFGPENVVCDSDVINPNYPGERIFSFSIFGESVGLAQKALWWETQGIDKSEKNESQLVELLRQHSETLFGNHKVGNVFISGAFNRVAVIDFQSAFDDNDVAYEVFKEAQKKLALFRAFVLVRNKDEKVNQFWIELEKIKALDVLRSASRNGLRLEA